MSSGGSNATHVNAVNGYRLLLREQDMENDEHAVGGTRSSLWGASSTRVKRACAAALTVSLVLIGTGLLAGPAAADDQPRVVTVQTTADKPVSVAAPSKGSVVNNVCVTGYTCVVRRVGRVGCADLHLRHAAAGFR
jgi:hypothetical protein